MKNGFRHFAFALSALHGLVPGLAQEPHAGPPGQDAVIAAARRIVDSYVEMGWFSGTVLLAREGQPILQTSFGLANRAAGTPNGEHTRYNLGSIVKHFTAVLVLQQVEKGTIDLEDRLEKFDLGFPQETAKRVSVQHLLHHRSGFPDIFTAEYREDPLAFDTMEERLGLHRDAALLFEPGSEYRYSNYGYIVLGAILEKLTGQPFAALLRQYIFDPLDMEDSVYPYRADSENQSLRYTFNHAGDQVFVGVTEHHGPDGGIEATAADVLAFYRALFYSEKLLSRQNGPARDFFGFEGKHWGAFGGGTGVSAAVEMDLQNDYQIVVLANTDHLVAEEISGRIFSFIETGRHKPPRLPPSTYAWTRYLEMGPDAFRSDFLSLYEADGYTQFIGRTLNELGMSLLQTEEWDGAFDIFDMLTGLFPEAPQVYDSLAFAFLDKGEPARAAEVFRRALALDPDFASDYSSDNYGTGSSPRPLRR